jgi:hypothetical protein
MTYKDFSFILLLMYFYAASIMIFYDKLDKIFNLGKSKFYSKDKSLPPALIVGCLFMAHAATIAGNSANLGLFVFSDLTYTAIIVVSTFLLLKYLTPKLGPLIRVYAPITASVACAFFAYIQLTVSA